jgi:hypothetical protein
MSIDLSSNTIVRRYTKTDLFGGPYQPYGLSADQIKRQNEQCGFRYGVKEYPITVTRDADSVYFKQGTGKVLVAEPVCKDDTTMDDRFGGRR